MHDEADGADAVRILLLPAAIGLGLLGVGLGVPLSPHGERMVTVLLGLCCLCLFVGGTLVALRTRRLEEAPPPEDEDEAPRAGGSGGDRSCPVGLFRVDSDGRCTWVSHGWCALTGQTAASAEGRGWEEVLHPDERIEARVEFAHAVVEGHQLAIDHRVRRPDGRVIHVVGQLAAAGRGRYVGVMTAIDAGRGLSRSAA